MTPAEMARHDRGECGCPPREARALASALGRVRTEHITFVEHVLNHRDRRKKNAGCLYEARAEWIERMWTALNTVREATTLEYAKSLANDALKENE